jgi:hypothetical protein
MPEEINHHRRRLLGSAAMSIAAAEFVLVGSANAQSSKITLAGAPTIQPGTNTSFGSLKQIDAGVLNVGYAEAGPAEGPAVILLHGWPYDIHSYVDVAPMLAARGCRVIVPHLRGHGTTRRPGDNGRDTPPRTCAERLTLHRPAVPRLLVAHPGQPGWANRPNFRAASSLCRSSWCYAPDPRPQRLRSFRRRIRPFE